MKCMTLFRNAQCQGTSSLGVGRIVCTKGLKPCETDPSRESMKKRTCQWSHYFICLCSPYEINWKMRGLFRWWWWISDRIFVNWHCFIHAPPVMTDFPRECSHHDLHRCCRRTQWIKEKLETNKRMERNSTAYSPSHLYRPVPSAPWLWLFIWGSWLIFCW